MFHVRLIVPSSTRRLLVIYAVVLVAGLGLSGATAHARPSGGSGVGCLKITHLDTYHNPDEYVYVQPGTATSQAYSVDYRGYNYITQSWGPWRYAGVYGDIDATACCDSCAPWCPCSEQGNVYEWMFQSQVFPLDSYNNVQWRVHIAQNFSGTGCDTESTRRVPEDYDNDTLYSDLYETACIGLNPENVYVFHQ